MSTIVLVPGAGLGGWVWSRVTPLLRHAGHDPHPITLTGTGDRAHLNHAGIDLTAWITDVVAHLETEELQNVTLVGHSFGASVLAGVADRAPGRLSRLVYLDAPHVLASGESAFAAMGPQQSGFLEGLAQAHDGWSLPWFADEQLDAFYGDHGLTRKDLRWIRRHVTAQPIATYREAVTFREASIPRTFVRCLRTPSRPAIAAGTPGWGEADIDAGHWPMVTAPRETAELLDALAREAGPARAAGAT